MLFHRQEVHPQPFQHMCKGFSCCCYLQATCTTSSSPELGFKYTVWFLARFSFVPAPAGFDPAYSMRLFSGFCPLQKYFKRSYSVGWGCSNVELMSPRSSVCPCLYWLWFRPAKLLCSCKHHGQLLQGSFLKNPGTPLYHNVCDISWLWRRLTSCVASRNTRSHPDTMQ